PPGSPLFPYTTLFRSARNGPLCTIAPCPDLILEAERCTTLSARSEFFSRGRGESSVVSTGDDRPDSLADKLNYLFEHTVLPGERSEEHTSELQSRENL